MACPLANPGDHNHDSLLSQAQRMLAERFGIRHTTIIDRDSGLEGPKAGLAVGASTSVAVFSHETHRKSYAENADAVGAPPKRSKSTESGRLLP